MSRSRLPDSLRGLKTCFGLATSYNICKRPFSIFFGPKKKSYYCTTVRCRPLCNIKKKILRYHDETRFTLESDSKRLLVYREQRTDTNNPTLLRHSYRDGGIMGWAGISVVGHTDQHVFHEGALTGVRYHDEIIDLYVRTYASAFDKDFILMDDNIRPLRAEVVENYQSRFRMNGRAS
ncbi:transposable element Tcb2 transposase [Trichonephila clavipes]|nr:transposable element Tcb2 transposase [Trichonephila clavipes]